MDILSYTKAKKAQEKAELAQEQLNLAIQNGDQPAETQQARMDNNGQIYATLKERLDAEHQSTAALLAETSRQTSVLSQGFSVVSSSDSALASVEIEGRTLVNLLGRLGRTGTSATVAVESAKFYVFVKHNQTTGAVTYLKYTGQTSLSLLWANGEYSALYEVESANYAKIGLDWDSVEVGLRYPYVDEVKTLQGVGLIAEGNNLIPPFTEGWTLHANAKAINPYELELTPSGTSQGSIAWVNVLPNTQYTVICSGTGAGILGLAEFKIDGVTYNGKDNNALSNNTPIKFITKAETYKLRVTVTNASNVGEIFRFRNPMLTLGTTVKPFVPRNPSSVIADVKLGAIGDKKDILYEDNGRWLLRESIKKYESLTLVSNIGTLTTNAVSNTAIITSADGSVFKRVTTLSGSGNEFTQSGTGNKTITFNTSALPISPVASYVLATVINADVTDKVEGSLKVNGLTQISVDSGYRRAVVDGKSTWTKGSKFDYTANPVMVKLTYANNIRSAVNDAVRKVQDNSSMLSIHEKAIVDLYVRVKALEVR